MESIHERRNRQEKVHIWSDQKLLLITTIQRLEVCLDEVNKLTPEIKVLIEQALAVFDRRKVGKI